MRERIAWAAGPIVAAVTVTPAFAGDFGPGPGGLVPDAMTSHSVPGVLASDIVIDNPGIVASLNSVTITFGNPGHTWVGDLQIILTAPNGDDVHLFSRTGANGPTSFGDSSDLNGTYVFVNGGGASFSAAAGTATSTQPVAPGTYNRETNTLVGATIGADTDGFGVFGGDQVQGAWRLTVKDWGVGDTGGLSGWNLNISLVPSPGSLALLGVAGLLGVARRRRRGVPAISGR
jgi:hypothetical protein